MFQSTRPRGARPDKLLHERADSAAPESRAGVRIARGLTLHSLRLGLSGKADVVEFRKVAEGIAGAILADVQGHWVPFPVEYKRGKPKRDDSDRVQLCAQALCLEEMLAVPVPAGALFYGTTRRRLDVHFDTRLRASTETACTSLHELLLSGRTPAAVRELLPLSALQHLIFCERQCALIHIEQAWRVMYLHARIVARERAGACTVRPCSRRAKGCS